ncbi:hypothetical protein Tco_1088804 [Tanacetum coccineum]
MVREISLSDFREKRERCLRGGGEEREDVRKESYGEMWWRDKSERGFHTFTLSFTAVCRYRRSPPSAATAAAAIAVHHPSIRSPPFTAAVIKVSRVRMLGLVKLKFGRRVQKGTIDICCISFTHAEHDMRTDKGSRDGTDEAVGSSTGVAHHAGSQPKEYL